MFTHQSTPGSAGGKRLARTKPDASSVLSLSIGQSLKKLKPAASAGGELPEELRGVVASFCRVRREEKRTR